MAPLPGACLIVCSRKYGSASKASAQRAPALLMRSCSPTAWPRAAARERETHCESIGNKVSALSARGIFKLSSVDKGNSDFGLEHSLGFWFLKMTYLTSPYQMNPFPQSAQRTASGGHQL